MLVSIAARQDGLGGILTIFDRKLVRNQSNLETISIDVLHETAQTTHMGHKASEKITIMQIVKSRVQNILRWASKLLYLKSYIEKCVFSANVQLRAFIVQMPIENTWVSWYKGPQIAEDS